MANARAMQVSTHDSTPEYLRTSSFGFFAPGYLIMYGNAGRCDVMLGWWAHWARMGLHSQLANYGSSPAARRIGMRSTGSRSRSEIPAPDLA